MAAVTVFLEAYDEADDYDMLNRVICAWREEEELTRRACGLASVATAYPGCFQYTSTAQTNRRNLLSEPNLTQSAHDIFLSNYFERQANSSSVPFSHDPEDDFDDGDFDWDQFIASQYESNDKRRRLMNYEHVEPWHNYFPMLGVRTEYYYRYSGTQTVPPCYGKFFRDNNRKQTNHHRVMKGMLW